MFFLKATVILMLSTSFFGVWQNWYRDALFGKRGNYVVAFVYVAALLVFGSVYDAFKVGIYRMHELSYSLSLAALFTNFFTYLILCLIARRMMNPLGMILLLVAQVVIIILMMYLMSHVYFSLYKARRVLAIFEHGNQNDIIKKVQIIRERFQLTKGITTDRGLEAIKREVDGYDTVLICDFDPTMKSEVLKYCYAKNKRIYLLPSSADTILNGSYQVQVFDTPVLFLHNGGLSMEQRIIKRIFDILLSLLGIIVLSPIMLITAIAIKLTSKGPIIFKQKRITRDQKEFCIYKFRSMKVSDTNEVKKTTVDDDRVTVVGKIIRPLRIDETPQLFNILFGDMSIVGPRPEMKELVDDYSAKLPEFNLRHKVKAGLTGYAQVYGQYNTTPYDKLQMDLIYIANTSVLEDLKICFATVKILFMPESTEGVAEGQTTAMSEEKNV